MIRRWVLVVLIAVAAALFFYLVASAVGSLIDRNPSWRESADGIRHFVRRSGTE